MVEYIEKIQYPNGETHELYSDCCRGKWVPKYLNLASSVQYKQGTQTVYSLADYLPDDGYDYEVIASLIGNTASGAVGNCFYAWYRSGTSNWLSARVLSVRTSTTTPENAAGTIIIPIKASDRNIAVWSETGSSATTGNCWAWIGGYRRLGKNDWNNTDGYHKIQFSEGRELSLGGRNLPGKWIVKRADLWSNYNMPATSDPIKIDLSGMIPNDGFDYECILDGTAHSSQTDQRYASVRFNFANTGIWMCANECVTRAGANTRKINYFNFRVPIYANAKYIELRNTGNDVCVVNFRFEGYRRIGYYG